MNIFKNKDCFKENFSTMKYILKIANELDKYYISTMVILSILKAISPFINLFFIKLIINELTNNRNVNNLITEIIICLILNLIVNISIKIINRILEIKNLKFFKAIDIRIGKKSLDIEFEMVEDPIILDLKEQAIFPIQNEAALENTIENFAEILTEIIFSIFAIITLCTVNIFFIVIISSTILLTKFLLNKIQDNEYKVYQDVIPLSRKFSYFAKLTSDFSIAKDVKLYNIGGLIINKVSLFLDRTIDYLGNMEIYTTKINGIIKFIEEFQIGIIYLFLAYNAYNRKISISDFVFYASIVTNLMSYLDQLLNKYLEVDQFLRYLLNFVKYDKLHTSLDGNLVNRSYENYNIEFKNVYFKYPRATEYTLKNINISISAGENLSIVGLNGAGKTTFIKLLSKLYKPTRGEIMLNGVNIEQYSKKEYMKLLSVVFQDYKLFPISIKENIILDNEKSIDNKEILSILKEIGLYNDVKKLKLGLDTPIYKIFDKDGIELSGGQSQKVAIARAIAKDSPIVILDEPTAALDPISESEIYMNFSKLVKDKTSIFISHRLSSCKFCDKIAVFKDGEIIQYGNHEELLNQSGSLYEEMYNTQAKYYSACNLN